MNYFVSDNTWYYSLSTIAQAFAAIVGLYAIFVVFKIEKINEFLEELRSITISLIASVQTQENIGSSVVADEQTLIKLSNRDLLVKMQESIVTARKMGTSLSYSTKRLHYRKMENIPLTFQSEIEKKESIITSFKLNLILSFSVILSAILLLVMSDIVRCYKFLLFVELVWVFVITVVIFTSMHKIIKE